MFTTHYSPDSLFKYKIKTSKDKKPPLFWFLDNSKLPELNGFSDNLQK